MPGAARIEDPFELAAGLEIGLRSVRPGERRLAAQDAVLQLGNELDALDLRGTEYMIRCMAALNRVVRPPDPRPKLFRFGETAIWGSLQGFAYLGLGGIMNNVGDSLCAEFGRIIMLPGCERLSSHNTLYVPVLEIAEKLSIPNPSSRHGLN